MSYYVQLIVALRMTFDQIPEHATAQSGLCTKFAITVSKEEKCVNCRCNNL